MNSFIADIRYALRTLRLNPAYTIIAIVCVALGIGTNTTVYSAVNAMILRPLAFEHADRVLRLYETNKKLDVTESSMSLATLTDVGAQAKTLDGVAGYSERDIAIGGSDESEQSRRVEAVVVTANLFKLLGIAPTLGRDFSPAETHAGTNQVALISDRLWHDVYNADRRVLGQTILLDGKPHKVIGVMPIGMRFPETRDLWTPASTDSMPSRAYHEYSVVARAKPGVTAEQASGEVATIVERLARDNPTTLLNASARALPFQDTLVDEYRGLLWTMLGAVSFVLLIACGNVANLMLARATARQREIALRTALGASRWRIVRQLLTESVIIALAGGVFGILIAVWGLDLIVSAIPYELPYWMHFDIDARVLAYTVAVSVGTGCLFGLAPAFKATAPNLNETLKDGSRGASPSARHHRLRNALVIGETALCLVLLVGATLMMRSFVRMQTVDTGFQTKGVLTADVMLPLSRYPDPLKRVQFFNALNARVATIPGVTSAALVNYSPLSGANTSTNYSIEGRTIAGREPLTELRAVTGSYFATLGMPIKSGRTFTPAEDADTTATLAIVNETFVRRNFPTESPLGKRVRWGWTGQLLTIVGVVPDVRQRQLKDPPTAQIYIPQSIFHRRTMNVLLRTAGDPAALAGALRAAVASIDPIVPMYEVMSLEAMRRRSMWESRVFGSMFAAFGVIALVLASIGLYGVISYGVAQRTHELGVRMALGAQARDVLQLVVRQGSRLALIGVAVGLPLAFLVTRTLRTQLYGVSVTDPMSYIGISLLLAAIALLASYIPARRASRVDPMVALRSE